MSPARRPPTAVIGAGKLARAFLPSMAAAGYPIVAVAARSLASARGACAGLRGARPTTDLAAAVARARLVLLAVPDREIAGVARAIARAGPGTLHDRVFLHHAGALGLDPLRPLARSGAGVGILHPFQCLGIPRIATALLPGSRARIDGDARGARAAARLARDLGLRPLRLASPRGEPARLAYHASASLVSNDLVALVSLALPVLRESGVGARDALEALVGLARGTLAHIEAGGLKGALTGPVVRADAPTVRSQLRRLSASSGRTEAVHRLLSEELSSLAAAFRLLTPAEHAALARLLRSTRPAARGRSGGSRV